MSPFLYGVAIGLVILLSVYFFIIGYRIDWTYKLNKAHIERVYDYLMSKLKTEHLFVDGNPYYRSFDAQRFWLNPFKWNRLDFVLDKERFFTIYPELKGDK